MLKTPGGRSVSRQAIANFAALLGVSSLGLITIVLPVISAGAVLRAIRKNGKFHGRMPPITPIGWRNRKMFSPGRSLVDDLALDPARPLGHVVDVVGGERGLDPREGKDLALLLGDHARNCLGIVADLPGDAPQMRGPLDRRKASPPPWAALRGFYGLLDDRSRRVRHSPK